MSSYTKPVTYRYKTLEELYHAAVMQWEPENLRLYHKNFATNELSADTPQDLWNNTGSLTWATSPETITAVSTDVNDTAAGTGVRSLRLVGIDSNGDHLEEELILNGTTPVTSSSNFNFLNWVATLDKGPSDINAGTITLSGTTSTNTYGIIRPSEGITTNSHFLVPKGFRALIYYTTISISQPGGTSIKEAELTLVQQWKRANGNYATFKYPLTLLGTRGSGIYNLPFPVQGWQMNPEVRQWLEVEAAATQTIVEGEMQILVFKDDGEPNTFY